MTVTADDIQGVVPILPTPFHSDESIDESGYERMLAFAEKAGCRAIGLPAFGSEFYKLTGGERNKILDAVFNTDTRLGIIVQCNHISPIVVTELIGDAEKRGASAINVALPRAMPVNDDQLLAFARNVCSATDLPVIIQDYNPGGSIVGLQFAKKLSDEFPNFRFIKYEVPGIGPLINDILQATSGSVKVFSGWGASYMLELVSAGIAGIMPGIPLADYFNQLWIYAVNNNRVAALKMFTSISPYLMFSLQNLELFHHAEKRLAVRRGILRSGMVRNITVSLDSYQNKYLEEILDQTCDAIAQNGLTVKAV